MFREIIKTQNISRVEHHQTHNMTFQRGLFQDTGLTAKLTTADRKYTPKKNSLRQKLTAGKKKQDTQKSNPEPQVNGPL